MNERTALGWRRILFLFAGACFIAVAEAAAPPQPATRPGETVERYEDGAIKARFKSDPQGRRHGAYEEFTPLGKPRVRGTYTADVKTGSWTTFDDTGRTIESAVYSKDGSLNGPYTWYTPGGKGGGFKATFANGAIVGTVTVLDDKGRVLRTANYPRPWGDVCKAWSMLYPGEVRPATYVEPTKATAPYAAGKVEPECLEDALKVTKLYRYLSGLKWQHLTLTADGNVKAQHGAVLLEKIGNLTHTPGQPADMPADFFKVAYAGCNQSNIYSGLPNLVSSVRGYMDDSDANNIQKVGHRRWVLAPGLQKVGFGISGRYSAMHVIGNVGPAPAFDFVTFPGDGYYPRQLVEKDYAWSAHLAFSKTKVPEKGDLKIKIIRLDDHFQAGDETAGEVVSVLSDAGQGWNVIVFKPNMPKLELGKYWVEIQGIKSNRAGDVPFGYIVDFADMTSVPRQASPNATTQPAKSGSGGR